MATIQVREVPEEAYEVIRRRARARGQSIQAYMRDRVVELASRPAPDEALAALDQALGSEPTPGATRDSVLDALTADRR